MKSSCFCGILCVATALGGCGKPPDRVEITEVQTRSETRPPARIDATSRDRFRYALPASSSMAAADPNAPFHWSAPATWEELPPTQFRLANFRFGANGEGECSISLLQGGGGGVLANVNRWRGQLGLSGLTTDELAALPRKTVLEQDAVLIDFEGAYTGMGNSASKADYRMLGALLEYEGQGVYVKMVGPAEAVAREKLYFDAFLHSLYSRSGQEDGPAASGSAVAQALSGELPEGHPDIGGTTAAALALPSESAGHGYRWEAPSGWSRGGERPMRLATYSAGDGGAECVVSLLGGEAGGLVMNLNRWLGQFGQPARTEADFLGGPRVSILGESVPLVFTAGEYRGMDGQARPGHALLGAARISAGGSLFIKMIGPEKAVEAERANFVAFCESFDTN